MKLHSPLASSASAPTFSSAIFRRPEDRRSAVSDCFFAMRADYKLADNVLRILQKTASDNGVAGAAFASYPGGEFRNLKIAFDGRNAEIMGELDVAGQIVR
ncbi:hypothetical protein L596_023881 [Steinernema carpocapsae]|uniref:Uncharacterized protein n=1 Tax=Steinernema carpocapsae TaxID=34508 RepID=A0A4U5MF05_STECR|nr:hypothetical protein L596_023881 [Steinernema carpocapsae]